MNIEIPEKLHQAAFFVGKILDLKPEEIICNHVDSQIIEAKESWFELCEIAHTYEYRLDEIDAMDKRMREVLPSNKTLVWSEIEDHPGFYEFRIIDLIEFPEYCPPENAGESLTDDVDTGDLNNIVQFPYEEEKPKTQISNPVGFLMFLAEMAREPKRLNVPSERQNFLENLPSFLEAVATEVHRRIP